MLLPVAAATVRIIASHILQSLVFRCKRHGASSKGWKVVGIHPTKAPSVSTSRRQAIMSFSCLEYILWSYKGSYCTANSQVTNAPNTLTQLETE